MTTSTANFRLEFINDVHARWLPVLSPKGSLCLPDDEISGYAEYVTACGTQSVGGAARWATRSAEISQIDIDATLDANIVRIILGDEFTGTPLFSSGTVNVANGEENRGYGAALHHYESAYVRDNSPTLLLVPGNHEFDMGLETLGDYLEDSIALGTKVLCANCNFKNNADCDWKDTQAPYESSHIIERNGIKLGFWGMTVIKMSKVSICPAGCNIKTHAEIIDEFKAFYDSVDQVVIISHMGLDDEVLFGQYLGDNMPSVDKIVGIYGSHTHSVICGEEGVDRDGLNGVIDSTLGSNGLTACDTLGRYDGSVKDTLNASAYTSETIDGNEYEFPNYHTLISGGINIYHHAMHGLIHGSQLLMGTKTDSADATFEIFPTEFKTLDSAVVLQEDVIKAQINDINAMVRLAKTNVARTDQVLSSDCYGAAGCDGGYLLAMGAAGMGSKEILPYLTGYEDFRGGMVSIINGGGIRADIGAGQMSLLSVYSTYPFLNNLAGQMTTGESLWKNLLHGTVGFGEGQFFGARMVLAEGQTVEKIKTKYQAEATAAGVTIDDYFCSGHYVNKMTGRNMAYENVVETKHQLHSSATATTYASVDIADDGIGHAVYAGKGCHAVDAAVEYNFEINICALDHFIDTRAAGTKTEDFFPPPYFNDCACWETIVPTKEYLLMSFDFVLDGGDGYCLEDTKNIRYDHNGTFDNDEAGCAALVIDFFTTYQNNVSGNKSFQLVTGITEAPATEAPATEAPATEAPATEAPASGGLGMYAMRSATIALIVGLFF